MAAVRGTTHALNLRPWLARMQGRVVTHNHPSAISFSLEYLATAAWGEVAEMRAITPTACIAWHRRRMKPGQVD